MKPIDKASLLRALESALHVAITDAEYQAQWLAGGTVGEVYRVTGTAATAQGPMPFDLVLKIQKRWERHGDPDCWRREYDIYHDGLWKDFSPQIRLPRPYLLEEGGDITYIWMEALHGKTGSDQLHKEELAFTALRLGEMQARLHLAGRKDWRCLRSFPAFRSSFDLWGTVAGPLARGMQGFPEEVSRALLSYVPRAEELFSALETLPRTICQGDVHHDNIILREEAGETLVYLIDWDSAGYGVMGEDAVDMVMEAFVYSGRDVSLVPEYLSGVLAAYREGARRGGVRLALDSDQVLALIALSWGFRLAVLFHDYGKENNKSEQKRVVQILRLLLAGTKM